MACAREYARTGTARQYSRRQVSRHKARYGVAEVVAPVVSAPVVAAEEAPNIVENAANDVHSPDDLNLMDDVHPLDDVQSPDGVHSPGPVVLAVDDQQYGSQRDDGMGRPRNAFAVHDPAKLELLLDLCSKHNLTCAGKCFVHVPCSLFQSSFSVFLVLLPVLLSLFCCLASPMHSLVATHSNCGLCFQLYGGPPATTPIPCTTLECSMFAAPRCRHVVQGPLVPGCVPANKCYVHCSRLRAACRGHIWADCESLGGRVGCKWMFA
jgi:hypothetical protein